MTQFRFANFILSAAALSLAACGGETTPAPKADSFLTNLKTDYPVSFAKVADNVWVHTTNYRLPGQSPIASNGLVVRDGNDVVLVDGAWGELATVALLEAVKTEVGKPVTKMVVTHHPRLVTSKTPKVNADNAAKGETGKPAIKPVPKPKTAKDVRDLK